MAPLPYPPTLAPSPALRKAKTVPPPPSEADHQAPGPVRLEHGSVGAVTFANPRDVDRELEHDVRRRLDLRFMGRRGTDAVRLQEVVAPVLVFPSTRRRPLAPCNDTPELIAEASKRFLTTMPEVAHVPYELLHEPILTAHKAAVETATTGPAWDPYEGNRIATTSAQNIFFANQAAVGLVAFPTGQLGQELNVSTLTVKVSRRAPPKERFTPSVRPVATFLTPIQQIVSSPYQTNNHGHFRKSHLAVRTTSHVHLIDLELRTTVHENDEPVVPQELLAISRDMTSGGRHMDVAMSPWERTRGVGVSDDGTIWEFGMQNRDGVVYPRGKGKVAVSLEARLPRSFHRIDYGSTTFEASVLSDQTARLLDLRSPVDSLLLFDLRGSTSFLTSLERKSSDARFSSNLLCVSTTESVSWLDKRMPGKAVVSWDHHRSFDRSLELVSLDDENLSTVLLTSRRDNVVTAYTTASDSVESLHAPYLITPPTQAGLPKEPSTRSRTVKAEEVLLSRPVFDTRHGCSFFRHPSLPSDYKDVLFLELSTRGGVVARRLRMGTESEIQVIDPFIATPSILNDWTPDVKQLAEVGEAAEEVTEAARWDGRLERMAGVYKQATAFEGLSSTDEQTLFERYLAAVNYLREPDNRHRSMLTGHDLAHHANAVPGSSRRRSLFLSDSGIHPSPTQGKAVFDLLGRAPIGQGAAACHSVVPRIEALVGSLPSDASRLPKELWTSFGMPSQFKGDESSTDQRTTARHACHLLALDLVLASNIYSSEGAVPPPELDPEDELERATQALSLYGDDGSKKTSLPPLHFSLFRPVLRGHDLKGKSRASDGVAVDGTPTGNATARSLMSAWIVGEDPHEHRHVDLHGMDHKRASRLESSSAAAAAAFASSQAPYPSQSQARSQPPTISITPAPLPLPTFSQTGRRLQAPALVTTQPSVLPSFRLFGAEKSAENGGSGGSLPALRAHDSLPAFARAAESSQPQPTFSSQEYDLGPQTQVLPGAYGGRPGAGVGGGGAAKKAKKKRVGGF